MLCINLHSAVPAIIDQLKLMVLQDDQCRLSAKAEQLKNALSETSRKINGFSC
ncbi:hypothetical protein NTG1052_50093 [Candidatus Nitrotoga sp. 1052]|nr:hypothetical protein NTG1052_50093 [Candidatus Nitrotoga sp. 1052]